MLPYPTLALVTLITLSATNNASAAFAALDNLSCLGSALLPAAAHQAVGVPLLQRLQCGGDGGRVGGRRRLEASEQGHVLRANDYGNGSALGRQKIPVPLVGDK